MVCFAYRLVMSHILSLNRLQFLIFLLNPDTAAVRSAVAAAPGVACLIWLRLWRKEQTARLADRANKVNTRASSTAHRLQEVAVLSAKDLENPLNSRASITSLQVKSIFLKLTAQATPPARNSMAPMMFIRRGTKAETAVTNSETMLIMAEMMP